MSVSTVVVALNAQTLRPSTSTACTTNAASSTGHLPRRYSPCLATSVRYLLNSGTPADTLGFVPALRSPTVGSGRGLEMCDARRRLARSA